MQILREKMMKTALFGLIVVLCALVLGVILFGVKQFQIGSQMASVNQVANLSHLLVRQQTNLFSILLMNNASTEKLTENLDNLTKEVFVLDASLYKANGELLAQSSDAQTVRLQLGLEREATGSSAGHQQIVEPIYSKNGVEGFLRITLDTKYGQITSNKVNRLFSRLYGELIVVFLVGVLLASSTHYFLSHYRRAKRHSVELPTNIVKKTPSRAATIYHRRRKRRI